MIRLPVALGLAHLAAAHPDPDPERGPAAARVSLLAAAVPVVAALAVAALAVPAVHQRAGRGRAYPQIPRYRGLRGQLACTVPRLAGALETARRRVRPACVGSPRTMLEPLSTVTGPNAT